MMRTRTDVAQVPCWRSRALASLLSATIASLLAGCETTTVGYGTPRLPERSIADRGEDGDAEEERRPSTEEELLAAVLDAPDDPRPHYELGLYYESLRRFADAEACYVRGGALVQGDHWVGPPYFLGRVRFMQGKYEVAEGELLRAIRVSQDRSELYVMNTAYRESFFLLGCIAHSRRDVERARFHWEYFLRLGGEVERLVRWMPDLIAYRGAPPGEHEPLLPDPLPPHALPPVDGAPIAVGAPSPAEGPP